MRIRFTLGMALGALMVLGILGGQPAQAAIVNGSFEGFPDFTGYTTIGNAAIQQADFHATADEVSPLGQQALISNNTAPIPGSVGAVTNIPSLDTFFNLGAGTLAGLNVKSGSGFKQTFFATAGDVLTFKYDFATNEPVNGNQDFGFTTLQGPGGGNATLTQLLSANPVGATIATNPLLGINSLFATETGYLTGSINILTSGNYTLAFGVANRTDTLNASGLLVDAIAGATGAPGGAVPLPAGMYLMLPGLLMAGLYVRKYRRCAAC